MFQFKRDFNDYFVGVRDIAFARTLNPELQSLRPVAGTAQGRDPAAVISTVPRSARGQDASVPPRRPAP